MATYTGVQFFRGHGVVWLFMAVPRRHGHTHILYTDCPVIRPRGAIAVRSSVVLLPLCFTVASTVYILTFISVTNDQFTAYAPTSSKRNCKCSGRPISTTIVAAKCTGFMSSAALICPNVDMVCGRPSSYAYSPTALHNHNPDL